MTTIFLFLRKENFFLPPLNHFVMMMTIESIYNSSLHFFLLFTHSQNVCYIFKIPKSINNMNIYIIHKDDDEKRDDRPINKFHIHLFIHSLIARRSGN